MKQQEKLNLLSGAFVPLSEENDKIVFNNYIHEDVKEALLGIMFNFNENHNVGNIDLVYLMAKTACDYISDFSLDDIIENNKETWANIGDDYSSPYIGDRLGYLNANNQDEITELVKEHNTDIQQACADWFNNKMIDLITTIGNWIEKE